MKKIKFIIQLYIVFFASYYSSLQATDSNNRDETSSQLKIHFWNEDIGSVKGGNFLRDQEFLITGKSGKYPGSGLFLIPNGLNFESDSYPLFFLIPVVRIIKNRDKLLKSLV